MNMKFTDRLRLKIPGHKSVDDVVGVAKRNNLPEIELCLVSRTKLSPAGMFSADVTEVYAMLEGRRAKMYTSGLMLNGFNPTRREEQQTVLNHIIEIGRQIKEVGLTPTVARYQGSFDQFVAEYQSQQ